MWWDPKGHVIVFRRRAWVKTGREDRRQDLKGERVVESKMRPQGKIGNESIGQI